MTRGTKALALAAGVLMLMACLAGGGGAAAAAQGIPADPGNPAYTALFPPPQSEGEVAVEVRTSPKALQRIITAGFGVPFPPGYVGDPNKITLIDSVGQEIPIHVRVLARWPEPVPGAGSIRAALIQFRTIVGSSLPRTYKIRWGTPRLESEPRGWPTRTDWVEAEGGGYPRGAVLEPPIMVGFPAQWLGKCLLKGPILPGFANPMDETYDRAMVYWFKVAINDVSPQMEAKKRIDFVDGYEPWLYDRSAAFFVTYFRTGKFDALRQAHMAAQYYASKINADGKFLLLKTKTQIDPKYCYPECLALDYWFTGDDHLLGAARDMMPVLRSFHYVYKPGGGHWTERHFAFAMLGEVVNYELTGDPDSLARARAIFEQGLRMQFEPADGVPQGHGCLVHLGRQHGEKGVDDLWVCSPWMSELYMDALLRYYIVTADSRVPEALIALGDFIVQRGTHKAELSPRLPLYTVPYYLVNVTGPVRTEVEPWSDRQHAPEMVMMLSVADYFRRKAARPDPRLNDCLRRCKTTMEWVFEPALRKSSKDKGGLPNLNLGPPRKYNWWFRTTANFDWYQKN